MEDEGGEGNLLLTPFGNVILCKTKEEIKAPHLSIIIMSKRKHKYLNGQ